MRGKMQMKNMFKYYLSNKRRGISLIFVMALTVFSIYFVTSLVQSIFSTVEYSNICLLYTSYASMDDIIEASKSAQAHDFINELPLRYETRLEENGANLSGGRCV